MRSVPGFALVVALCLSASGCDESDNYLRGSLADSYNLDFDDVRVRLYLSELSIEYLVDSAQGEKVTLRVTLQSAALAEGAKYNLKTQGTIGRGQGFDAALPELESGTLELDEYSGANGSGVTGSFDALFLTAEQSKLSLRGGFSADLELIRGTGN